MNRFYHLQPIERGFTVRGDGFVILRSTIEKALNVEPVVTLKFGAPFEGVVAVVRTWPAEGECIGATLCDGDCKYRTGIEQVGARKNFGAVADAVGVRQGCIRAIWRRTL